LASVQFLVAWAASEFDCNFDHNIMIIIIIKSWLGWKFLI
jgi:hypothetical protein